MAEVLVSLLASSSARVLVLAWEIVWVSVLVLVSVTVRVLVLVLASEDVWDLVLALAWEGESALVLEQVLGKVSVPVSVVVLVDV